MYIVLFSCCILLMLISHYAQYNIHDVFSPRLSFIKPQNCLLLMPIDHAYKILVA